MPMPIRDADPAEAPALEELQRRASLVWDDHRDDLIAHPDAIEVPASLFTEGEVRVAVDDEAGVVGFSVVLPITSFDPDDPAASRDGSEATGTAARRTAAELDGLFVEPDWQRGRGVGRALVDDAAGRAAARGEARLLVIANTNALGFYEKVGFARIGEVPTRFGPGLRMARPLP
ncbi:MAG: GNAT family N-acetyltransferase [Acidimicrobiales bacterium]